MAEETEDIKREDLEKEYFETLFPLIEAGGFDKITEPLIASWEALRLNILDYVSIIEAGGEENKKLIQDSISLLPPLSPINLPEAVLARLSGNEKTMLLAMIGEANNILRYIEDVKMIFADYEKIMIREYKKSYEAFIKNPVNIKMYVDKFGAEKAGKEFLNEEKQKINDYLSKIKTTENETEKKKIFNEVRSKYFATRYILDEKIPAHLEYKLKAIEELSE